MIRRPPRSTRKESSAASDVYKRQEEDKDLETLITKMSGATITDLSCPLCGHKLQHRDGRYKCKGLCYLGLFPQTKKWVEGLKERIGDFLKEHRCDWSDGRNKHECRGEFAFNVDEGVEVLIFTECVGCGYLNYVKVCEIDSL
eukprot:TRINITY_DN15410_c0_g1_i7.p1 TRINITY_DN15410_c0_g1~~TRINITY_DN15410_c0_g1_i7.p1  ORF type:complete len:150 (-),score=43.18 TRINITY_DN15410_c0_g1_i7:98-526(-)